MKEFLNRNEYIYLDAATNMSVKGLSNIMYAAIVCQASFPTIWALDIYEDRKINSRFRVNVKVHIHPSQVSKFEELSAVVLKKPIQVTLNSSQPNYG